MTHDPAALLGLAAKCEAAEGPDRALDALIAVALGAWPNTLEAEQSTTDETEWSVVEREPDGHKVGRFSPERYTASFDAALTLVPRGHNVELRMPVGFGPEAYIWKPGEDNNSAKAATPALALTAAALRIFFTPPKETNDGNE